MIFKLRDKDDEVKSKLLNLTTSWQSELLFSLNDFYISIGKKEKYYKTNT